MKNDVDWTDDIYRAFVHEAMLNDADAELLRQTIKGDTIQCRALREHMGTATVSRRIRWMRNRYDAVQPMSKVLPIRRKQKCETRKKLA